MITLNDVKLMKSKYPQNVDFAWAHNTCVDPFIAFGEHLALFPIGSVVISGFGKGHIWYPTSQKDWEKMMSLETFFPASS